MGAGDVISMAENYRESTTSKETSGLTYGGELVRKFDLIFDPATDPVLIPLLAVDFEGTVDGISVPKLWDNHPGDPFMFVKRKHDEWVAPFHRNVIVSYIRIQDPLEQLWEQSWTFSDVSEPIDKDINGDPIENSSGEPPDPPIIEEFHDLVWRVVRFSDNWNARDAANIKGAVNDGVWQGWPAGTAKVTLLDADQLLIGNTIYYQETIEIHFRYIENNPQASGWKRRILDQGFRTRSTTTPGEYNIIKDEDGNPLSQPIKLDGNGQKLAEGAAAVYKEWNTKQQYPFSNLNLDNPPG